MKRTWLALRLTTASLLLIAPSAMAQTAEAPVRKAGDTWSRSHGLMVTVVSADDNGSVESGYIASCPTCLIHYDKTWNFTGTVTDANGKPVDATTVQGVLTGPGWRFYDWPLEVNKTWRFSGQGFSRGQPQRYDVTATVKAFEDVKTKAGAFKAFKIQYDWESGSRFGSGGRWTTTVWYAPEVRNVVKFTTTSTGGQEWEMTSYSLK